MSAWGLLVALLRVAYTRRGRAIDQNARLNPLNRKINRGLVADSHETRSLLIGLGTTRHQGRGTLGDILTYSLIPARRRAQQLQLARVVPVAVSERVIDGPRIVARQGPGFLQLVHNLHVPYYTRVCCTARILAVGGSWRGGSLCGGYPAPHVSGGGGSARKSC